MRLRGSGAIFIWRSGSGLGSGSGVIFGAIGQRGDDRNFVPASRGMATVTVEPIRQNIERANARENARRQFSVSNAAVVNELGGGFHHSHIHQVERTDRNRGDGEDHTDGLP